MKSYRFLSIVIPIVGLLLLVAAIVLISNEFNKNKSIEDTDAFTESSLILQVDTTENISAGDEVIVSLQANFIDETTDVRSAHIVLEFDNTIFEATDTIEGQDISALNENIENNLGRVTVDLINAGGGNFPTNQVLVAFKFIALQNDPSSSRIKLSNQTTFGVPNTINTNLPSVDVGVKLQVCGDGNIDEPNGLDVIEKCDDGNNNNGDRCSADCMTLCPEGFVYDGRVCSDYKIGTTATPSPSSTLVPTNSPTVTVTTTPTPTPIITNIPTPTASVNPTNTTVVTVTPTLTVSVSSTPTVTSTENTNSSEQLLFYIVISLAVFTAGTAVYMVIKH